jgi:amino acid adenylation domain-containing protein/non-ribosomal peptide synthase protein (TIGR01720 family)
MFQEQVQLRPQHIALTTEREVVTYAELEARANRLANRLIACGAGPEHVVGVCLDRSVALIVSFLAIWKAGAAYLPLHDLPDARLRYLRSSSGARLVATEGKYARQLGAAGFDIVEVDSGETAAQSSAPPATRSVPGNLAYVMYTSGSTGEPKGVLVEHRSLANYMQWVLREYGLGDRERVLMKTSIAFDASLREWLMPLLQGGTLMLLQEGLQRDPQALIRELDTRQATTLHAVPTLLRVLLEERSFETSRELLRVFAGGELLDAALVRRFHQTPGRTLINMYGPTETTVSATSLVMGAQGRGEIGRPVAGAQVHVLRGDLSRAAIGETGEICIGGVAVTRGYCGRPDDTADKYVPDPYSVAGGERLYRTGDRGRLRPDGVCEFLGRKDGQVKVRGYRVELNEIECALQAERDVLHAAVLLQQRATGDHHLVAYVQLGPNAASASIAEIDAGLRRRLPDYMCPAQYVRLDSMPRTRSGKLDRVALAALETIEAQQGCVEPRNPVEAQLATLWSAVLGIDKVGVTDNFFQIGGDSIVAIQITARARQEGFQFTPLQLFQYQTIEELAKAAQPVQPGIAATPIAAGEPFALTPIQQTYFERRTDNIHHFNQGLLLVVPAHIEQPLLERALTAICRHHDALHLNFEQTDDGWRQSYAPAEPVIVHQDLTRSEDPVQVMRAAIDAQQTSLNICSGPLMRMVMFHLGGDHGDRLLLLAHHLVVDTVSWRILLDDLRECYAQLLRGAEPQQPLRTSSYQSWSAGLREYVRTQDLGADLAYWRKVEQRVTQRLLADDPAGANTVGLERAHVARLQETETRALLSEATKPYKTQLMELLLSALSEALHRWCGRTATAVMLEGHGREEIVAGVDLTRTVGWFTSLYPVVLESREGESIGERIKRTKEQLRAIPRRGVSHGLLRHLCADSGLSGGGSLLVNYLGQMDGSIGREALLPAAREASVDSASPGLQRASDLTLNAMIHGGRLQMHWTYSGARFRDQTVASLAEHLQASLRDLIAHCCSPQAGGFTPSDVTDFGWGAKQLDVVARAISAAENPHAS